MTDNKGIVLFLVLWVLTLLSVIAGEFCHTMRTGIYITRNFKEETQAYYIAKAGLNIAVSELIKNETRPQKVISEKIDIEEEESIDWRINAEIPPISFAEGAFTVYIGNESGKININRADTPLLTMMLNRFELDEDEKKTIVDSILDWRDNDDLHRLNGAETQYYQSLPEPYNAKNRDFDSVEELLLVKGMKKEIFYGGIRDIITVYPKTDPVEKIKKAEEKKDEDKKKSFDFNKININAASVRMLQALPLMTDETVQAVLEFRQKEDFKSLSQLLPLLGDEVYQAVSPYLSLESSPIFTISSTGTIAESNIRTGVQAVLKIDVKSKKKYHIIQWLDNIEYNVRQAAEG